MVESNGEGAVFCVTGIDTDIGKTIVTGLLAKAVLQTGKKIITAKAVQTGCEGISEDIIYHRKQMGCELFDEDREGITCPYLFKVPCSPHLAADIEGREINPGVITANIDLLKKRYELVLLEGAGGLFVPLTGDHLMIDFFKSNDWPVILVSSSRLGSINHTLASIEALRSRDMELSGLVYNCFTDTDPRIERDSLQVISRSLKGYGYDCPVVVVKDEASYEHIESLDEFLPLCGL